MLGTSVYSNKLLVLVMCVYHNRTSNWVPATLPRTNWEVLALLSYPNYRIAAIAGLVHPLAHPIPSGEPSQAHSLKKEVFCQHRVAAVSFPTIPIPGTFTSTVIPLVAYQYRRSSRQRLLTAVAHVWVIPSKQTVEFPVHSVDLSTVV